MFPSIGIIDLLFVPFAMEHHLVLRTQHRSPLTKTRFKTAATHVIETKLIKVHTAFLSDTGNRKGKNSTTTIVTWK